MALIDSLVATAAADLGADPTTAGVADVAVLALAGADFPHDDRQLAAAAAPFGWAERVMVVNDALAMLRAGSDHPAAISLVCGAGINCVGQAPDGRTVRFPALGDLSGDWGGGYDIGMAAVGAAMRAQDGRGPGTLLAAEISRHFGLGRPSTVVFAIHTGRIDHWRLLELPPVVFAAADTGDPVAVAIVERQADELVGMATAALRRLHLTRSVVEVVLGGGVLTAGYQPLLDRVAAGVLAVAPQARLVPLRSAPVAGAALMGLSELRLAVGSDVRATVHEAFHGEERP
jgi:N-acetylglucosamine kinase-like BadF-type ATPase